MASSIYGFLTRRRNKRPIGLRRRSSLSQPHQRPLRHRQHKQECLRSKPRHLRRPPLYNQIRQDFARRLIPSREEQSQQGSIKVCGIGSTLGNYPIHFLPISNRHWGVPRSKNTRREPSRAQRISDDSRTCLRQGPQGLPPRTSRPSRPWPSRPWRSSLPHQLNLHPRLSLSACRSMCSCPMAGHSRGPCGISRKMDKPSPLYATMGADSARILSSRSARVRPPQP